MGTVTHLDESPFPPCCSRRRAHTKTSKAVCRPTARHPTGPAESRTPDTHKLPRLYASRWQATMRGQPSSRAHAVVTPSHSQSGSLDSKLPCDPDWTRTYTCTHSPPGSLDSKLPRDPGEMHKPIHKTTPATIMQSRLLAQPHDGNTGSDSTKEKSEPRIDHARKGSVNKQ